MKDYLNFLPAAMLLMSFVIFSELRTEMELI